jgi:hypothetical protein
MFAIYDSASHNAARTAALAAGAGTRRQAYWSSWSTTLGSNPRLRTYHVDTGTGTRTLVVDAALTGSLSSTSGRVTIPATTVNASATKAIDNGLWEFRIEKVGDSTKFLGVAVTRAGSQGTLSSNGDATSGQSFTTGPIYIDAPPYDTDLPSITRSSSLQSAANTASVSMAMAAQPASGAKIVVPFAAYRSSGGTASNTAPAVGQTGEFTCFDLANLKKNTDGSGGTPVVGDTIRRINNVNTTVGGYFSNATGLTLAQDSATGAYYLNVPDGNTQVWTYTGNWETLIGATAGEAIVACRPAAYSEPGADPWYCENVWMAGDGEAGVAFHAATTAVVYANDGTADQQDLTIVSGADVVITWTHSSGQLGGKVGTGDPASSVASGTTGGTGVAMALFGPYHAAGGWPRFEGRFYGVVFKTAALSTSDRASVQGWFASKLSGGTGSATFAASDNAAQNNAYQIVVTGASPDGTVLAGFAVCQSVAPGSGTFTVTLTAPQSSGWTVSAQAHEFAGLIGLSAVDPLGTSTAQGTGTPGSLTVAGGDVTDLTNLIIAVYGLRNGDSAANLTKDAAHTLLGSAQQDASTLVGYLASYRIETAGAPNTATATHDAVAGQSAAAIIALRAGVNTDPAGGGGGSGGGEPSGTEFTRALIITDSKFTGTPAKTADNEMTLQGMLDVWDWTHYGRLGEGANPHTDSVWTDPEFTSWLHWGFKVGYSPSTVNFRLAVYGMWALERFSGTWSVIPMPSAGTGLEGAWYTDYGTNANLAMDIRYTNGFIEGKPRLWTKNGVPTYEGAWHAYPRARANIANSGREHLAVIVKAALVLDNPALPDDRATAQANTALHVGGDWYAFPGAVWSPTQYNVNDFAINRNRQVAIAPAFSVHTVCTMTSDADIDGFISAVNALNLL